MHARPLRAIQHLLFDDNIYGPDYPDYELYKTACGVYYRRKHNGSRDPRKVDCRFCRRTRVYKKMMADLGEEL